MDYSPATRRFGFGDNWMRFLAVVDEPRVDSSIAELRAKLGVDSLRGRTFLDVGCGSGLSSLAAVRLGAARVVSFDYDTDSVAATRTLKQRFAPDAEWSIDRGDATDETYMAALGIFDVVYSWGVLHHTGEMWRALANTCHRVAPGGALLIAIYNDQGRRSKVWRAVKRTYNRLPRTARVPYAVAVTAPTEARAFAGAVARGRPRDYVRSWSRPRERGMSHWHDLIDWVGGYPFEVATPDEIFRFCRERGFELTELETCGGGLGCNQFVFRRAGRG